MRDSGDTKEKSQPNQLALHRALRAIADLPAQVLFYGTALLSVAAIGGVEMPEAGLGLLATGVGVNILSSMLERIARGELTDEDIRAQVKKAIEESDIAKQLTTRENQVLLAGLFRQLDVLQFALQDGQCDIALAITEQSRVYKTLAGELASDLSALKAQVGMLATHEQIEYLIQVTTREILPGAAPHFTVPFPPNPDFVGRDEELAQLHKMISQGDSPVGIRPTVLVGLGGIGKTQLAAEYAHRHRNNYPSGVFWVNAIDPLLDGFAGVAEMLGLADRDTPRDQAARQAWAYLDAHPDALVIFDNVVEPAKLNDPFVPGLIPANLCCRTLFTTRQRDFPRNFQPFEVRVLPEMAAMQLLLRERPKILAEHDPEAEWEAARIVCATLGWLPLALELAAAYLGTYGDVAPRDYLRRLRTEGRLTTVDDTELRAEDLPTRYHELIAASSGDLAERHHIAVRATLETQWARLHDEDARLLFQAAGQFPEATWIPTARLGLLTGITDEAEPGHPAPLTRGLNGLHAVSLIEELQQGQVRLHPLVREFAAGLTSEGEEGPFREWCAANMAAAYEDVAVMEEHCARRGVDAVQRDLTAGLGLLSTSGAGKTTAVRAALQGMLQVMQREAHVLRGWSRGESPALFAQQVHNRALDRRIGALTASAADRLAVLGLPWLKLGWRAGRESVMLERTLAGHAGVVQAVAVTPDGRRAVSASHDRTLKVWDLETGAEIRTLTGHAGVVQAVAMTPDGRRALSASGDGALKMWDLETGRETRTLVGHAGVAVAVAVTGDGQRAVSASRDRTLKVWDLETGAEIHTLAGHAGEVNAVAVTGDGRRALSGSLDRTLKVWGLETGADERTLTGHRYEVDAVAVTPDGRRAVSASSGGTLKVWDLETGAEIRTLTGHRYEVDAVAVTPDGRRAVSASRDWTLKVWDLDTGAEIRTLAGHDGWVNGVGVTGDGRRAVSASGDGTLKVWNLETGAEIRTLAGHAGVVQAVAVTPDGRRAVSASRYQTLKMWDVEAGREMRTLTGRTYDTVAVTPDGQRAVSASWWGKTLRVWDLETGAKMRALVGRAGVAVAVAVTGDGRRAVSGSLYGTLKVWDLETGAEIRTLAGHPGSVNTVAVTGDGQRAVSGSMDHTVKVWDMETGAKICTLTGHDGWVNGVAVTGDGQRAVSASRDGTLKVWDLETGVEIRTLAGHESWVNGVGVTGDGRWAVSVSHDRTLRVWDLETGAELASAALDGALHCLALTPDGATCVVGGAVGDVYCFQYVEGGNREG
jgi:WD40 repeat protein